MHSRRTRQLAIVFMVLTLLMAPQGAGATAESIGGTVYRNVEVNYLTERTVTVGGSNIYFQKSDGPALSLTWYRCGNTAVRGSWVYFENDDPTNRLMVDWGFAYGARFYLSTISHGNNYQDTFSGTLWWNVFS